MEIKIVHQKYLFQTKEDNNGGIEEQRRHMTQKTNSKFTLSVITVNVN